MTNDIEQLLVFGRIGLETGYYEQARGYFEQVLALDPSNREAMKGLGRVNEILSRREALAAEPIQEKLVKPPHKVERKRHILEEETEEQDRSLVQWFKLRQSELWKIAIAGVPLLFLLCAGLANMINPTPEATPTVVPTAKLAPTPTTARLVPTATPGLSAKERAYAMEVIDILEDWNTATFELAVLSYEASQNPLLLTDYNWRLRASDPLATLQICGQRVHELSAPTRFQGVHQDLTQATRHSTHAVTLYAQGVDELDSDKLSQSADEMSLAETYMQQASAKLERISQ